MEQTVNQRLKILRKALNKTQSQFADVVGLKQGSYADVERGKVNVSGDIKVALNKEYSINIEWLETGEGEKFIKRTINYEDRGDVADDFFYESIEPTPLTNKIKPDISRDIENIEKLARLLEKKLINQEQYDFMVSQIVKK